MAQDNVKKDMLNLELEKVLVHKLGMELGMKKMSQTSPCVKLSKEEAWQGLQA